jgi:hypothetical protein
MLRLPFFWRDSGPIYAWPPLTPPVFTSMVVPAGPGPDWQAEIAARNEAQRKESERVAAFYARQEAEREEREAAEARGESAPNRTPPAGGVANLTITLATRERCPQSATGDIRSFER